MTQYPFFILSVIVSLFLWFKPGYIVYDFVNPGKPQLCMMKFDDRVLKYAKEKYPFENTYTSTNGGGFALYTWSPGKKVFIDTFWNPHSQALYDYNAELIRDPRKIAKLCDTACVLYKDQRMIEQFAKAGWRLEAIDMAYVLLSKTPKKLNILCKENDFKEQPRKHFIIFIKTLQRFGVKVRVK